MNVPSRNENTSIRYCKQCGTSFNIVKGNRLIPNKEFCSNTCNMKEKTIRRQKGIEYIRQNHPDIYRKAFRCV